MKTYPKYKDSGIDWIGHIPSYWCVSRIKDVADIFAGATPSSKVNSYWDGDVIWVTPADMTDFGYIEQGSTNISELGYNSCGTHLVPAGSIILSSRAPIGKVNIANKSLCTNQGCKSLVLKNGINGKYLAYYLHNECSNIDACGQGTTFKELSLKNLVCYKILFPPIEEQCAIAAYLDEKCGAIDGQVELLEKKRKAYERLKTSVINHAVTHGLNPDVAMRPSGIDWLGDIPAHWQVKRVKELGILGSGTTPKSGNDAYYDDGTNPWLNTGCVQNCIITEPAKYVTDLALRECNGLKYFPKNTILIAMYGGGTIGNVGLMSFDATINQACCAIVLQSQHNPKYFFYALMAQNSKLVSLGFGGTQINLSQGQIANFILSVPPIDEQRAIATYLDEKCGEIDANIENIGKQIDAYKRLKRSLINEVVTGKRAV